MTSRVWPIAALKGWRAGRVGWLVVAVILIAACAGTAALTLGGGARRQTLPPGAVLRVGNTVITAADYDARLKVLSALYGVSVPTGGPDVPNFRKDAAKAIAVSLILDDAAAANGVHVTDQQAQSALDQLVKQVLPGGQATLAQFLKTKGVTQVQVLDEVKRQLETSALFASVTKGIPLGSPSAAKALYSQDAAGMTTPEERRIGNIVVETSQQASALIQQLRSGASFAGLASKYSLDGSTRGKGGDLGWMTSDQLDPTYAKAAFAAAVGSPFGPLQTQYGWNIGVVNAVQAARPLTFAQAEMKLRTQLQDEEQLSKWRSWLAQEIVAAHAEYANDYQPANPDAAPTDLPSSLPGK